MRTAQNTRAYRDVYDYIQLQNRKVLFFCSQRETNHPKGPRAGKPSIKSYTCLYACVLFLFLLCCAEEPYIAFLGVLTLYLGPPGTGKTTALLREVDKLLSRGVRPEEVAYVSFTRAACQEAVSRAIERFNYTSKSFPWWRTIHSAAYKIVSPHAEIMSGEHWKEFTRLYGYRLSAGRPSEVPRLDATAKGHDALLQVLQWSKSQRMTLHQAHRVCPTRVDLTDLEVFAERLGTFCGRHQLIDFNDLLVAALVHDDRPDDVRYAIVDEAQDLTVLQIALVEKWFDHCDGVFVAGDDDQSLYDFAGANPHWLADLVQKADKVVRLNQSHRVPAVIQSMADRIMRPVQNRVVKTWQPRPNAKGVIRELTRDNAVRRIALFPEKRIFVLARERHLLNPWVAELMLHSVEFKGKGDVAARHNAAWTAVTAAVDLANHRGVEPDDLLTLKRFAPALDKVQKKVREFKKKKRTPGGIPLVTPDTLEEWGFADWLKRCKAEGPLPVLTKLSPTEASYFHRLLARNEGVLPDPKDVKVTLSTIHARKGGEADIVVVVPDMSTRSWEAYTRGGMAAEEQEHRIAYVACTRAREELWLVHSRAKKQFPYSRFAR